MIDLRVSILGDENYCLHGLMGWWSFSCVLVVTTLILDNFLNTCNSLSSNMTKIMEIEVDGLGSVYRGWMVWCKWMIWLNVVEKRLRGKYGGRKSILSFPYLSSTVLPFPLFLSCLLSPLSVTLSALQSLMDHWRGCGVLYQAMKLDTASLLASVVWNCFSIN